MVHGIKEVAPNRYRETFGRYFEDFTVGDIYEHRPGRTITQTDNTWFTLLTMNTHPLHFDEEYGKATEFGRTVVCSPFTVSLMAGMSVSDVMNLLYFDTDNIADAKRALEIDALSPGWRGSFEERVAKA